MRTSYANNGRRANLVPHAEQRMQLPERISQDVTKEDIISTIKSGNFTFARRESNTRSLIYGETNNEEPFKAIYSRKDDMVITFLPICHTFKTNWFYFLFRKNVYRLQLFPDCYLESDNPNIMTKFELWIPREQIFEETTKRGEVFIPLFDLVWGVNKNDWYEANIKKTRAIPKT
jgi:hypothetical protein